MPLSVGARPSAAAEMLSARRRRWPSGLQALLGLPTSKREEVDLTCTQARNPANLPFERLTAMLRLKRTPKDIISALPLPLWLLGLVLLANLPIAGLYLVMR